MSTLTSMTPRQRMVLETTSARDQAEALLRGLLTARERSEQYLVEAKKPDAIRSITGRSAMDNAIASTRRMIDTLNRTLAELTSELTDEDLALLDEDPAA